jgi:hypothetical protein
VVYADGIIPEDLVLYVEYATMCLTLPFLSIWLEPNDWDAVLHYNALDWGNLLFTALGVSYSCISNFLRPGCFMQIEAIVKD